MTVGTPVALYSPTLDPGGAERVLIALANGFARAGHPTHLITLTGHGALTATVAPAVRIHVLDCGLAAAVPRIVWLLRRNHVKGMLVNYDGRAAIPGLAALVAGVPYVPIVHSDVHPPFAWMDGGAIRQAIFRALVWLTYRAAWAVAAVSERGARGTERDLGLRAGRILVPPTPVLAPEIVGLASEPVGHPWFTHKDRSVIVTASRLVPEKDIPTLVRAFAELRRSRRARLVIIGDGAARSEIERVVSAEGVSEDVLLTGFDLNPWRWVARADCFAVSSLSEGICCALIEAAGLGVPVVSTDCGVREVLGGGRWGVLVPVGHHRSMADALAAVLDGRSDVTGAREAMWARFSGETAVAAYRQILFAPHPMARSEGHRTRPPRRGSSKS